jgi:tRNA (uracil-5-)-methyltransferase TRM9
LVAIAAKHDPHTALVSDILSLPHPVNRFDFAICIAVVHHLSTRERRIAAVKAVLDTLKDTTGVKSDEQFPNQVYQSAALIYVWALEQKNSRRGWDETSSQDVMVPWVLQNPAVERKQKKQPSEAHDTLKSSDTQGPSDHIGRNQDNGRSLLNTKSGAAATARAENPEKPTSSPTKTIFQRYYHLYRAGELEMDSAEAGGLILDSGYEKDNWWAIATRSVATNDSR